MNRFFTNVNLIEGYIATASIDTTFTFYIFHSNFPQYSLNCDAWAIAYFL